MAGARSRCWRRRERAATRATRALRRLNALLLRRLRAAEMLGVLMRIASFFVVSWLGTHSPFLVVWAVNTVDAALLSWCAILIRDPAYTILNVFWIGVGVVGMLRAAAVGHP